VKAQDEAAFREYVSTRMERLRRTAYLLCHDWHTADDLVAIALDKLFQRWKRAREMADLDAYTRRILLNAWLDERRRPWRREFTRERLPDGPAPAAPAPADEHGLLTLLRTLPRHQRAVLVLRFFCDLSVEETAETLGVPTGTVKSQTARGLDALRAVIDTNRPDESGART
jgi:RNA polymerase sigma-70 factor (sigma-E family)